MRPDMRMFWIDPATGKMKVDHGFNLYTPEPDTGPREPDNSYNDDHGDEE